MFKTRCIFQNVSDLVKVGNRGIWLRGHSVAGAQARRVKVRHPALEGHRLRSSRANDGLDPTRWRFTAT